MFTFTLRVPVVSAIMPSRRTEVDVTASNWGQLKNRAERFSRHELHIPAAVVAITEQEAWHQHYPQLRAANCTPMGDLNGYDAPLAVRLDREQSRYRR